MRGSSRTTTALKRWSCQDNSLPEVEKIKAIHIYDFDNTLFCSPLPNKQIWNGPTLGQLQALEYFATGGWWHDTNILASTGKGIEVEEPRAWEGWWNENIVELVRLSMAQKDAVTVLLTGRKESGFSDLILRMIKAKGLEFDMVCLKPLVGPANQKVTSTMSFKQELLKDLVFTYSDAEDVKMYEDRPKHTRAFRDFFTAINRSLQMPDSPEPRSSFTAEVIQVSEQATTLDPVTEVAEVQRMINAHNVLFNTGRAPHGSIPLTIKRTVFYTGYIISPTDTERLTALVNNTQGAPDHEMRYLANSILITPRPAGGSILAKVGGMGRKLTWKITGLSILENKVWAARVAPVNPSDTYYTENPTPMIVLALRRNARPIDANRITNWTPVPDDQSFEIETIVGEKVLLRVEEERLGEDEWESKFPRRTEGRKVLRDEDFPPLGSQGSNASRPQQRHPRDDNRRASGGRDSGFKGNNQGRNNRGGGGRGGGGGFNRSNRPGRSGGNGPARSRGRGGQYRSLDDNVGNGYGGATGGGMQY